MFGDMNQRIRYKPAQPKVPVLGAGFVPFLRPSVLSRASLATLTDDPDVQCTLQPGNYRVKIDLLFQVGNNTGGAQFNFRFVGGSTSSIISGRLSIPATSSAVTNAVSSIPTATFPSANGTFYVSGATSNYPAWVTAQFVMDVNAVGSLRLQWAQSISNATALSLFYGSGIEVMRVG